MGRRTQGNPSIALFCENCILEYRDSLKPLAFLIKEIHQGTIKVHIDRQRRDPKELLR
jgi:hypothetical protein